jgi:hypothetical protein
VGKKRGRACVCVGVSVCLYTCVRAQTLHDTFLLHKIHGIKKSRKDLPRSARFFSMKGA